MPLLTAAVVRAAAALARRDALPSYVYDLGHLDAHLTVLAGALRGSGLRAELLYAVKANPEAGVLEVVARHVDGFEVASGGELAHVRALVPGARLHLGGPGKTDAELAAAVAQGVHRVHVESLDELRRLDAAADGPVRRSPCCFVSTSRTGLRGECWPCPVGRARSAWTRPRPTRAWRRRPGCLGWRW
jgi:diaminopimelate decarboxylase